MEGEKVDESEEGEAVREEIAYARAAECVFDLVVRAWPIKLKYSYNNMIFY